MIDATIVNIEELPCLPLDRRRDLPNCSAVYFIRDASGQFLYIGQSERLVFRWAGSAHHQYYKIQEYEAPSIAWLEVPRDSLVDVELYFIRKHDPLLNVKAGYLDEGDIYSGEVMEVTEIECSREWCGHTWWPRVANPIKCPRCQNPLPRPAGGFKNLKQ